MGRMREDVVVGRIPTGGRYGWIWTEKDAGSSTTRTSHQQAIATHVIASRRARSWARRKLSRPMYNVSDSDSDPQQNQQEAHERMSPCRSVHPHLRSHSESDSDSDARLPYAHADMADVHLDARDMHLDLTLAGLRVLVHAHVQSLLPALPRP